MDTRDKLAAEVRGLWDRADREARNLTPEERGEVAQLLGKLEQQKALADRNQAAQTAVETLGGNGSPQMLRGDGGTGVFPFTPDPGRAFIESDGYKGIKDPAARGQRFTSGPVEVPLQTKGTLFEGTGAPGSGTGGGLIPVPDVVPGVVEKLLVSPLGVADLFASFQVQTNTVRYVVEGTATSGATGVAEGAVKPESTLGLSTLDEPVKKIATSIVVSDELIEDAQATQGFVSGRLTHFVKIEEEEQILRGGGTNDLVGIFGRSGVNTYSRGTVDSNIECIGKVIGSTRGSSFVEPDAVVMNPANWMSTRLLKDGNGQYYGGGPFSGAYGNAGAATMFSQFLWDKPVILSDAIGAGTALVGNFGQAAALARRSMPTVEVSNSHEDFFVRDKVAIRAEERLALCVYRANAFTVVSGLS